MKESGIKAGDYTIRQLGFPYGSTWNRLDEYTRQILEQLGFKVNLESTDAGGWASRTGNWDFDITTTYAYQYGDPALGVERLYVASNIRKGSPFANVQGYNNPELDKVWAEAAAATDPAKRQALYTKIQTKLVEDVANAYLIDMEFPTLYRSNIKNLVTTAIGLNESFDNVYIAKSITIGNGNYRPSPTSPPHRAGAGFNPFPAPTPPPLDTRENTGTPQ